MGEGLHSLLQWSESKKIDTKIGWRWVRSWQIPQAYLEGFTVFWERNKKILRAQGYSFSKNPIGQWMVSEWQAKKGDFRVNFGKDNAPDKIDDAVSTLKNYTVKNVDGLRDWQVPLVAKLCAAITKHGAAIDGSETGTGKTYCATAVARELGLKIGIVCPKAVITPWTKVINKHFGMKAEFVLNYESVKTGKYKNIGVWKNVSKISTRQKFVWNIPKDTLLVFDESHRLKGMNTQNSEIAIEAKKQGYAILCASATNSISPLELKAVGFILGLYKVGKWTQFLRDCDCERGRFGWEFGGDRKVLAKLHFDMFKERGSRIRKNEIPGFPDCDTVAEAYDIDQSSESEMKAIFKEMNDELTSLKSKCKSTQEWKVNAMVIQLRARQRCEMLKVPLLCDMVEDALADGLSIAVFVNFSDTIRALSKRLGTKCIVWGDNVKGERDKNIADFQSDKERVILINAAAGGTGTSLHDLNGNYPRLSLISPGPSAVILKQVLGRIHRADALTKATQRIVFIARTEEEDVCDKLKIKLEQLDLINDNDLSPAIFE